MIECKCCFEYKDKEDFSYSIDLKDVDFVGHCNDCVVELGGLQNPSELRWSNSGARYYHRYYKHDSNFMEYNKERSRKKYHANPEYFRVHSEEKRILKMERTLCGDYREEMEEIYKEARNLRESGEDVHVDHIVPLKGKNVSGLHVPWNLQIIPAEENLSKGNRFDTYVEVY